MENENVPEGMLIMIKALLKGIIHKELPASKRDSIDSVFESFYNENVRIYSPRELKERFSTAENCVRIFLEHLEKQERTGSDSPSKRVVEAL